MRTFKFYKENNRWYIDLPEWEGQKSELEMVVGADEFLDIVSENGEEVLINISTEFFFGCSKLRLTHIDPSEGAWYQSDTYHRMWLCDVTKFVFGDFPETIFFSKMVV